MTKIDQEETYEKKPHSLRLPGFIVSEEIGLGDVIKRVTYAIGIQPCGGCDKRAATLNRLMVFSPKSIPKK